MLNADGTYIYHIKPENTPIKIIRQIIRQILEVLKFTQTSQNCAPKFVRFLISLFSAPKSMEKNVFWVKENAVAAGQLSASFCKFVSIKKLQNEDIKP